MTAEQLKQRGFTPKGLGGEYLITVWLCAERGTSMAYSCCYMLFINRLKIYSNEK